MVRGTDLSHLARSGRSVGTVGNGTSGDQRRSGTHHVGTLARTGATEPNGSNPMPTTTLAEDRQALRTLVDGRTALDEYGKPLATVSMKEPGIINFAGSRWPDLTTGSGKQIKHDV